MENKEEILDKNDIQKENDNLTEENSQDDVSMQETTEEKTVLIEQDKQEKLKTQGNTKESKKTKKNNERGPRLSNLRPHDLEFDENIDDKYTSTFIDKYKNGQTKNKWFTWSGMLSILFGVACIVAMIVVTIRYLSIGDTLEDVQRKTITVCAIIFPIIGLLSIFIGLKIKSFTHFVKDDYSKKLCTIVLFIILQFLFGGFIFAFLTIVGYFTGIGLDYGAIYYNRINVNSSKQRQLADAKAMYQNELIDYEEYQTLKRNILNNEEDY